MKKKILALTTAAILAAGMFAGCGANEEASDSTTETSTASTSEKSTTEASSEETGETSEEGAEATEFPEYRFGTNIWGSGSYVLESNAKTANVNYEGLGLTFEGISNDFTADKITTDVQTQISDGVDAIIETPLTQPSFLAVAQICEDNGVPFVYYDKVPQDDATQEALENNYSMYVGNIVCSDFQFGYEIGARMIEDGCTKALVVRSSIGDASHDERQKGFEQAFVEEGGGEILGTAICASPAEAVDKSNDVITAYGQQADSVYALGSDFATGTINAIAARSDDYSKELKIYTTDFTPDMAQLIIDGQLAALNGGQLEECSIAAALVCNWLDGHPILDEEGKAPFFNQMQPCTIDETNAQAYIDKMESGEPIIPQEYYKNLLWRYNPDVTYDDFVEFLTDYHNIYMEGILR